MFGKNRKSTPEAEAEVEPAEALAKAGPSLEALSRELAALSRRCEAAEAANALAFVAIADLFHDPKAASIEIRLDAAARAVEFESASAGIQALLGRIEKAYKADSRRQLRRASGRLQVHAGAGGRNY